MKRVLRGSVLTALAAAIECAAPNARAAVSWAAAVNGDFTDGTKWIGGIAPTPTDDVLFNITTLFPPGYSVTFPGHAIDQGTANYASNSLNIRGNVVTFLPSSQLNLTSSTYTLTDSISLGLVGGSTTLASALSVLSAPIITIGATANGFSGLNVNAGAVNATGAGLYIGTEGNGYLNVNAGAQVNNSGDTILGYANAGAGIVKVINGTWNNTSDTSPLVVGRDGAGQITISAGGKLTNGDSILGLNPDSSTGPTGTVTVTGSGSVWTNRKILTVGSMSTGVVQIQNGAMVTCDSAQLGAQVANRTGIVELTNTSFFSQNLDLNIGCVMTLTGTTGTGSLSIKSGSTVSTGRNAYVGSVGTGRVTITGAGSKWTVGGALNIANNGTVTLADGAAFAGTTGQSAGIITATGQSALKLSGLLQIGDDTSGPANPATINVNSASTVSTQETFVAATTAASAQVNLDGAGSTWNSTEQLYIGFMGTGGFAISNGAKVTASEAQLGTSNGGSGTLIVDGTGSSFTASVSMDVGVVGTGKVSVSHGGVVTVTDPFTVGSKGTVEGNSSIAANVRNSGTVAPGIAGTATASDAFGTLQINGNYTQTSNGLLRVDLHTLSEHDLLSIQGTVALAGVLNVNQAAGFAPIAGDRFTILTSTGLTSAFDNVTTQANLTTRLTTFYTATDVAILATDTSEKTWGIDANANSSVAANWIGGAPGAVDDKVAFSTAITADRTVTLDTSFTAGSIYFDGAKSYTLQGPGAITLLVSGGNSASLTVKDLHGAGSHTISAPLTIDNNATFNIAPLSTLRITQQINSAGVALTKTGTGTLVLKNVRADSLNDTAGTVQIAPGGGAAGISTLKSLTIDATAQLDLNDNDLLIDYSGESPYTTIRGYLLAGLNNDKVGIVSSTGKKAGNTIHAIVDNSLLHLSSWNGISIDDTTIIAKYSIRGDANLDGAVGFADLVAVAQNYGNNTGQATWTKGDFNYDGNVDFADLIVLAQNYGGAFPASLSDAPVNFNSDLTHAAAAVPEPSAINLGLAAIVATTQGRRRRY